MRHQQKYKKNRHFFKFFSQYRNTTIELEAGLSYFWSDNNTTTISRLILSTMAVSLANHRLAYKITNINPRGGLLLYDPY